MPLFGPPNIQKMKAKGNVKGLIRALSYGTEMRAREGATTTRSLIDWRRMRDQIRIDAAIALRDFGDVRAVEPLIALFKEDRGEFGIPAVEALAKIGPPAVPSLTLALKSDSPIVRRWAVLALGRIGDTSVIPPLVDALGDKMFQVQDSAVEELVRIGAPALEPLAVALKNCTVPVRELAAAMLGRIGDVRSLEPLAAAMKDNAVGVRTQATVALGRIGDNRAVQPLVAALTDDAERVRRRAIEALGEIGDAGAVPALVSSLKNRRESWSLQKSALEVLAKIGALAVRPLMAALVDLDDFVRDAAAETLGKIGKPAQGPLLEMIRDPNPDLRAAAVLGLGSIRDAALVEPLVSCLRDHEGKVRKVARQALKEMGWQPTDDVERAVSGIIEGDVRRLYDLDFPSIKEILIASLDWTMVADDWHVKGQIAKLLVRPGSQVSDSVISRAVDELGAYAEKCVEEIEKMARFRKSYEKEPDPAKVHDHVFGDYGILLAAAFGYSHIKNGGDCHNDTDASRRAVERLCQIVTPVSTNLLHHVSRLEDVRVAVRVAEVEYSERYPSGMASVDENLSFEAQRRAATDELARRGNPAYDLSAYKAEGCWRIP